MDLIAHLKSNPFLLAPMAGITDHAFRSFMKEMGVGVLTTELVSATGLEYKSQRTAALMSFDESQRPLGVQLFGENPLHVAHAAQFVEEKGADFVDLNFGCPVPKVVKKGAGSAMLKDLSSLKIFLRRVRSAISIPLTIKIRTGWDDSHRNSHEVASLASDEGITWVTIHGRTRAQGYEGLADWNYIGEVKSKSKIPVIGNGDIVTASQALQWLKQYQLDGIMMGRGALKNPYLFQEAKKLFSEAEGAQPHNLLLRSEAKNRDMGAAFARLSSYIARHCHEHLIQIQLKKFAAWYSSGYHGSAQFRKILFGTSSSEEVLRVVLAFFKAVRDESCAVTSSPEEGEDHQGFLMGGHG